jgi:predicted O-methyltransferase YrrM
MNAEVRKVLNELEQQGLAHDARETDRSRKVLNLQPDTAQIVSLLARGSGAKRVLEIGTSNGYSTIWLAVSVAPAGGRVISIDRSAEKQKMARKNLEKAGLSEHVELRCGDATEIVAALAGPFDFVFFDADRIDAHKQLALLLPKLAPSAFLLADNAVSHPAELANYLAMVQDLKDVQHALIPVGKGLSIALTGSS